MILGGENGTIGGSPVNLQEVKRKMAGPSMIQVNLEEDVVVCNKCQCEFFISGVRLAKMRPDFKTDQVGLITERPHMFCFSCGTMLPPDTADVIVKKDLKKGES